MHAAGELAGAGSAKRVARSGELAGLRAAHGAAARHRAAAARAAELEQLLDGSEAEAVAVAPPVSGERHGKCFACLCEDVTSKDIELSVAEGYDSIELSKRYTTVTMGPCQGRMCQLASVRLMAQETGAASTTSASRPRGRRGARCRWASSPAAPSSRPSARRSTPATASSARTSSGPGTGGAPTTTATRPARRCAVHEAAGLIDVSTLGKLLVRGPAAGEFLDLLYPNRFSDLRPGRVRYGVLISDAGRIIDDGTVCRLDERDLLRDDDLERRRRRRAVVLVVARGLGDGGAR